MGYPDERPIKRGAEPIFTLRAQDALAVPVLRKYIDECHEHGLIEQAGKAGESLAAFRDWQHENDEHTKLPNYGGGLPGTVNDARRRAG